MSGRLFQLALTLTIGVAYFGLVMQPDALDARDYATMVAIGFCLGIDVCRMMYWHRVGRHHADR